MLLLTEKQILQELYNFYKNPNFIKEKKKIFDTISKQTKNDINTDKEQLTIKADFRDIHKILKSNGYLPAKLGISSSYGMDTERLSFYKESEDGGYYYMSVIDSSGPFNLKKENMKVTLIFTYSKKKHLI